MLSRRAGGAAFAAFTAVTAFALTLALTIGPISAASAAGVSASQITAPTGPAYLVDEAAEEDGGSLIKIEGTTTGEGEVEIKCYWGATSSETIETEVQTKKHAFSVEIEPEMLPIRPCVLRAVPEGNTEAHPPAQTGPFKGPLIATSEFEADAENYTLSANALAGMFAFESIGACGLESSLLYSSTLESSNGLFDCDAAVSASNPEGTQSGLQLDGANAYTPAAAKDVEAELGAAIPGIPAIAVSKSISAATGIVTIDEEDPIVKCSPSAAFPPTKAGCEKFVSTGVTLQREWKTSNEGHVGWLNDTWRSTDGAAHELDAVYEQELSDNPSGSLELPGREAFAATATGEHVSLPSGAGTILYKSSSAEGEGGDAEDPQGAIVYDSAPSEPLAIYRGSDEPASNGFAMPYARTIPAAGSYTLRMAFVQGYGLPEVAKLAGEAQASYYPAVSISSPASGASITGTNPTVTVAGNASDSVALSSLMVNGKPVSVTGGSWSTTATLSPGANTITATATNEAGNSRSTSIAVTYTPPPPSSSEEHLGEKEKSAPSGTSSSGGSSSGGSATGGSSTTAKAAHASLLGAVSALKGKVAFTLSCVDASCDVQATLTTSERRDGAKLLALAARTTSKQLTVGSASLTIAAAHQQLVLITLNLAGRALLAKFGRLPVHLSVELLGSSPVATIISSNLIIKPPPKKRAG